MTSMKDYVITIGELIEKWCPDLEWDEIMDIATSDNALSRRAKRMVDKWVKEGLV